MKSFILLTSSLLIAPILGLSQGQNYTIDYSFLSSSACNMFGTGTPFGTLDYTHTAVYGSPIFDNYNSNNPNDPNVYSVELNCESGSPGLVFTTAYEIAFNFKQYDSYAISLFANATGSVTPLAALELTSNSFSADNLCNATSSVPSSTFSTYSTSNIGTTGMVWYYNIINTQIFQSYSHLLIAAEPQNGTTSDVTLYIRKVQIVDVPAFSISSSIGNISCVSQTPVTFTVANNNGNTGISSYSWNIGANN
jgi:hypothetical protein